MPGERLYKEARSLLIEGRYADSILSLKELISKRSNDPYYDDAFFLLGEIYFLYLNDYPKAIFFFNTLLSLEPVSPFSYRANRYIADIYENYILDYDKAIIEYNRLLNNYASSYKEKSEIQMKIAYSYFKMDNYYQSIIEFDHLISSYPNSAFLAEAYYQRSNIYYIQENYKKAIDGYNYIIEHFPNSAYAKDARIGIGDCLDEEGFPEKALQVFTELLKDYNDKKILNIKIESLKKRIEKRF